MQFYKYLAGVGLALALVACGGGGGSPGGVDPLEVNPNEFTIFIGDIIRAKISGGAPPYRAQVGIDESLLSVKIINGNELEAVGGQVAEGAPITVTDASNQSVIVKVKITDGQDVLRISPAVLTVPESANTPDLVLMVYGASATGGIQIFTDDETILLPSAPTVNADNSGYRVILAGGNTCVIGGRTVTITVVDAKGKIGTSNITIQDTNGVLDC